METSAENAVTYKIWDDMTWKKTAMKKAQKYNSGKKESAEGQGCPSHMIKSYKCSSIQIMRLAKNLSLVKLDLLSMVPYSQPGISSSLPHKAQNPQQTLLKKPSQLCHLTHSHALYMKLPTVKSLL